MLITVTLSERQEVRRAERDQGGAWPGPRTALRARAGAPEGLCGSGGAMARQCAIVVQRCTQAREGEEEGGSLGQLGE